MNGPMRPTPATMILRRDTAAAKKRARWTIALSAVLHAALFLLIMVLNRGADSAPVLTEITWMEGDGGSPAPAAAPAPQAPARVEHDVPGALVSHEQEQHFRRSERSADVEPAPQVDVATTDRLSERLAALQQASMVAPTPLPTTSSTGSDWGGAARVPSTAPGTGGASMTLRRGGAGGTGTALTLSRGTSRGAPLAAALPASAEKADDAPAQDPGTAVTRRLPAGTSLIGPVADRPILTYVRPVYPEWAKRDGVEGAVTLYFIVRSDGSVKENILIQRTAGFADFDDNARTALKAWRFEPLHGGRVGEQWGTITFQYRLGG